MEAVAQSGWVQQQTKLAVQWWSCWPQSEFVPHAVVMARRRLAGDHYDRRKLLLLARSPLMVLGAVLAVGGPPGLGDRLGDHARSPSRGRGLGDGDARLAGDRPRAGPREELPGAIALKLRAS